MVALPDQIKRIRPEANRTDSENTGGRSEGHSTENVWNPSETPALDLINLSPRDRLVWEPARCASRSSVVMPGAAWLERAYAAASDDVADAIAEAVAR